MTQSDCHRDTEFLCVSPAHLSSEPGRAVEFCVSVVLGEPEAAENNPP